MRKRIISFGLAAVLAAASVVSVSAADSSADSAAVSGAESVAESVYSYPDWQVDAEIPQAPSDGDTTITVGASPSPHAEILEQVKDSLAAKGWTLDVKEYSDYVQPNAALASGDLDANYFQHQPYLDEYNKENKTDLVGVVQIHYEPFGIFPGKTKSLDELADGAAVGVPNDATNEARALNLLEAAGLIKLKKGAGLNATKKDVVENKKNLQINEIEAAQLPRSLQDLDIAVVNGNYAIEAGLSVKNDALALEDEKSLGAKTYGNIIAVKSENEQSDKTKALVTALLSSKVRDYINQTYDGAVVPLF